MLVLLVVVDQRLVRRPHVHRSTSSPPCAQRPPLVVHHSHLACHHDLVKLLVAVRFRHHLAPCRPLAVRFHHLQVAVHPLAVLAPVVPVVLVDLASVLVLVHAPVVRVDLDSVLVLVHVLVLAHVLALVAPAPVVPAVHVLVLVHVRVDLVVLAPVVLVALLVQVLAPHVLVAALAAVLVVRAMVSDVHHARSRVHVAVVSLMNCSRSSRAIRIAMRQCLRAPSSSSAVGQHRSLLRS